MNAPAAPPNGGINAADPEVNARLAHIRSLLARRDVVVLDTESTGHREAEIIEVSIIDVNGRVLFDHLIRPRRMVMNHHAQKVHGISLSMLEDQPTLPDLLPELSRILADSLVLAWNAPFDNLMIQRSLAIWQLPDLFFRYACAMQMYAGLHGRRSYGLIKAVEASGLASLLKTHESHRALGDVNLLLALLRQVASVPDQPLLALP